MRRSPKRRKSPKNTKSRRRKSPGRKVRSRRKSPGRKVRSRRKSPGRKVRSRRKSPGRKVRSRRKSPGRKVRSRRKSPKKTKSRRRRKSSQMLGMLDILPPELQQNIVQKSSYLSRLNTRIVSRNLKEAVNVVPFAEDEDIIMITGGKVPTLEMGPWVTETDFVVDEIEEEEGRQHLYTTEVPDQWYIEGRWSRAARRGVGPIPGTGFWLREKACSIVIDNEMWVIGGGSPLESIVVYSSVSIYNPRTGWRRGPSMHHPRAFAVCGIVDGKLVVAGGVNGLRAGGGSPMIHSVEIFDFSTKSWTLSTADLPVENANGVLHRGCVFNNKLYVMSGGGMMGDDTKVCRFDGIAWEQLADIPSGDPFGDPQTLIPQTQCVIVYRGQMLMIGGTYEDDTSGDPLILAYDEDEDRWYAWRLGLPRREPHPLAVIYDGNLVVLGCRSSWMLREIVPDVWDWRQLAGEGLLYRKSACVGVLKV